MYDLKGEGADGTFIWNLYLGNLKGAKGIRITQGGNTPYSHKCTL